MKIGTVKEIKTHEYRVGLTPACVATYKSHGHEVFVQAGAGTNAGFDDADYQQAGARIVADAEDVFGRVEMIVKVKEPQPEEYELFQENQILFTYLHLAADEEQTKALMAKGVRAIAYETIQTKDGDLPCLKPMSEIAGKLSIQEGAKYLEKPFGGRGILLGGVPGVPRGKVGIIGGGVVGTNAAKIAVGMGAEVTVLDIDGKRLSYLDDIFQTRLTTLHSTRGNIEKIVRESDLLIGAVLIPGAKAPKLVRKTHLAMMKRHAVIVDVAVDQGGCVETTHPTTHDDPVFMVDEVLHYCVANMPGAVSISSTIALTSTTLPFGLSIAELGLEAAAKNNLAIKNGINVYKNECTQRHVAEAFNLEYVPIQKLLS